MTNENISVPSDEDVVHSAGEVVEHVTVEDDGDATIIESAVPAADAGAAGAAFPVDAANADTAIPPVIAVATPQEGILGVTLRELLITGVWLVAFVLSFFPLVGPLAGGASIWAGGLNWVLPIGLPTVAAFLVVLRRFSPEGIRRVGSLGIDQFASVAASVAAVSWAALLWQQIQISLAFPAAAGGVWIVGVELLLALALVALTVFAPLIPRLRDDFDGRRETLAHRNANPVRPVVARPRPVVAAAPVAPEPAPEVDFSVGAADAADDLDGDLADDLTEVPVTGDGSPYSSQFSSRSHAAGAQPGTASAALDEADYVPGYARRSAAPIVDVEDTHDAQEAPAEPEHDAPEQNAREHAEPDALTEVFAPLVEDRTEPSADAAGIAAELEIDDDIEETRTRAVQTVLPDAEEDDDREYVPEPSQPFWALAPEPRPVHDDRGAVLFEIGPDAWTLVLEDRGGAYVVRHDDGRVGYLHDTTNMTRG